MRVDYANLSGLHVDDANLAGARIVNCRLEGMTINGILVTDLIAAYEVARETNRGVLNSTPAALRERAGRRQVYRGSKNDSLSPYLVRGLCPRRSLEHRPCAAGGLSAVQVQMEVISQTESFGSTQWIRERTSGDPESEGIEAAAAVPA